MTDDQPAPPLYTPASGVRLPRMARVRQRFDTMRVTDIRGEIARGFAAYATDTIKPGMRVAITVGSRGIANIAAITAAVVAETHARGAEPFVVAAMGSHGGASAEGQRAVLAGYGVTEETVGCPIVSSMETVTLGETETGFTVYVDRAAYDSAGIILLNRVKPHSILTGDKGSGLMKMAGIGLGKRDGADSIHRKGVTEHLLPAARLVLARAPIVLGVAIVENSLDQTWKIETVPVPDIPAADVRLLAEARALLPTIPFDPLDVLIVERIGKNISGAGMDPNVVGMHRRAGGVPTREIRRIVALDLSEESHGNASGVGMADIVTARLRDKIDWHATYTNALTSDFLAGVKLPIACPTERAAIELALYPFDPEEARVVRVADTARLENMWVSEALLPALAHYPLIEQMSDLEEMVLETSRVRWP